MQTHVGRYAECRYRLPHAACARGIVVAGQQVPSELWIGLETRDQLFDLRHGKSFGIEDIARDQHRGRTRSLCGYADTIDGIEPLPAQQRGLLGREPTEGLPDLPVGSMYER